jgi:Mg2+ and Co2+ transporter CorA
MRHRRFNEIELRLILQSVSHYADYLSQVESEVKKQHDQIVQNLWPTRALKDPDYEKHRQINDQLETIHMKIIRLKSLERQLKIYHRALHY